MKKNFLDSIYLSIPVSVLFFWSLLNFWNINIYEGFNLALAASSVAFVGATATILSSVIIFLFSKHKRSIAVFIYYFFIGFFIFSPIQETLDGYVRIRYIGLGFISVALALTFITLRLRKNKEIMRPFLYTALFLSTLPGIQILGYYVFLEDDITFVSEASQQSLPVAVRRPNIYHLILDAYGRADQLLEITGFDNSHFLDFLKDQNFLVSANSHSNYNHTFYSISSMMKGEYITKFEPDIYKTRFNTFSIQRLRDMGYEMVSMATWLSESCNINFKCISSIEKGLFGKLGNLQMHLLKMTPLYKTLEKYASLIYGDTRNEVEDIRKGLSSFSHSGPFYFHGHVFMPHSPYTKDKNCRISNSTKTSGIFGNPAADAHGYSEYLQCTNTQVKKFVDEIVKRDPDAFIIIQSDHGSEILWQGGEKEYPLEAFEERYANFNAWRMPKNCMKFFPPRMTPINTFPLVFSCLTGQEPQFLPNLAYRVFGTTEKLQLVRKNEKWLQP